jgi:metal-sulfur cluster biosynthetic enzyme
MATEHSAQSAPASDADVPEDLDPIIADFVQALDTVPDPCCVLSGKNLSVLDMGLINRIEREGDTLVVGVTLTDTMCEFSHQIFTHIEALAEGLPDVARVVVQPEVLPIWSPERLSERAVTMIKGDASRFFKTWDLEKAGAGGEKQARRSAPDDSARPVKE